MNEILVIRPVIEIEKKLLVVDSGIIQITDIIKKEQKLNISMKIQNMMQMYINNYRDLQ